MEHQEPLEAAGVVRHPPDPVQGDLDLLFANAQLRQPEQVCGTHKNGASRLLNCTYILHTKLEKP